MPISSDQTCLLVEDYVSSLSMPEGILHLGVERRYLRRDQMRHVRQQAFV
jgi:hypothetical protein